MPHYRVLVEGTGFEMEIASGKVARGFFTTRFVSANSVDEAGEKALAMLRKSLATDTSCQSFRYAELSVSEVAVIGLLVRLRGTVKGFTFYVADE